MNTGIRQRGFLSELDIKATRSGGPGGQSVNKLNTKVTLRFNINNSQLLTVSEKQLLFQKLKNKLTSGNELIITNQESRSQLQNKMAAIEQFYSIITKALMPVKKRLRTKRTRASIEKRLSNKKQHSLKKADRRFKDI